MDEPDSPQPISDIVAGLDQMAAAFSTIAKVLGSYARDLAAEGITGEAALALLIAAQSELLHPGE